MDKDWVDIGRIRKPHGLRGNMRADLLTDVPERFKDLEQVWLESGNGERSPYTIESCKTERNALMLKFAGVDTPEAADKLRGAYIQVPDDQKAQLPEGQFYVCDLIGSKVLTEDGSEVGMLREILQMPANDIFVVDTPDGESLIPAIQEVIVELDAVNKRVVIRPMSGLIL